MISSRAEAVRAIVITLGNFYVSDDKDNFPLSTTIINMIGPYTMSGTECVGRCYDSINSYFINCRMYDNLLTSTSANECLSLLPTYILTLMVSSNCN